MSPSPKLLVEAESFDDFGGWVMDSQFELEMGSPYLLAHGNGIPVKDAITTIDIPQEGSYNIWVRAKDWVASHHPGRFNVIISGITLDTVFGANSQDWMWQFGGRMQLAKGPTKVALHDLSGFCGRCDAIFFSIDDTPPPAAVNETQRAWRRRLRGLPSEPVEVGTFDVIVVGGGMPGTIAALTAARLGERVALVQDRPFLGGNASPEIGLRPRGTTGHVVDEVYERRANGELIGQQLLEADSHATVFTEHTVYSAVTANSKIVSVDARDARSGREIRLSATTFIDCSGKAILGLYSGATTLFGRESRDEYGESLAPPQSDKMHHGNTIFFPGQVWSRKWPWSLCGPPDYVPDPAIRRRMATPMTHFWEYGQWLDPYRQGEHIRDHLLRAIYGTFFNVKNMEPKKYAHLELDFVAFVPAQGGFRRYKGDYVLSENDIRSHISFPDAVVQNEGAFCLHIPGHKAYDFRLLDWKWDERDGKPYDVPFRSLYSANIDNLMMAGKHISCTHVASSNTKFMGNGGQHAIATAAAAHLCKKYKTTPEDFASAVQKSLHNARHPNNGDEQGEVGPLKEIIYHQDGPYKFISWDDPIRTLSSYIGALSILFMAHYIPLTQMALKAGAIILGVMSVTEYVSRLFGSDTLLARLRPKEYRKIPESTLNAVLKDIHDLVQGFVVHFQRIIFVQDLDKTFAAFLGITAFYWTIKIVNPFWLVVLSLSSVYIVSLVNSSRSGEVTHDAMVHAKGLANKAVENGSAIAQEGKATAEELSSKVKESAMSKE
ncbi:hypothetical protein PT974_04678 [Cladobotryum mycophilum]|uniref:Reticulon domain-containing protein n=1 Tax=Cladobotryum mycophilum TaxID=491253 RepID=A0ABR0SWY7_9HYPO